jgi:predicted transcriptional regulator with HTH domain|tara:strand:- start:512 stop:784 length:273 start_codon:yes stop_codon:yes gene_type:complete
MKISKEKKEKISEQILAVLYSLNPQAIFTSHIAKEVARDEEFTKKILTDLKSKNLVKEIKKNSKGKEYLKRSRWNLTEEAYMKYKKISSP